MLKKINQIVYKKLFYLLVLFLCSIFINYGPPLTSYIGGNNNENGQDTCVLEIFKIKPYIVHNAYDQVIVELNSKNLISASISENRKYLFNYDYELTMSLSKQRYKEYEPVYVLLKFINNDDKEIDIGGWFNHNDQVANFIIKDDKGNKWHSSKSKFIGNWDYSVGSYKVKSHDTLMVSMPVNSWGDYLNVNIPPFGDKLCSMAGYFPSGKKYTIRYDNEIIKSNDVDFEVISLNDEDQEFLKTYDLVRQKQIPFNEVIKDHPDNSLCEYIMVANLIAKYWNVIWDDNEKYPDLEKEYNKFFQKYPNTYYLYFNSFMAPYLIKIIGNQTDYKSVVTTVIEKDITHQLNDYLRNKNIYDRIKSIIETYKK